MNDAERLVDTIKTLADPMQPHVTDFFAKAKHAGYGRLEITEAYRSLTRQAELYGHGRTRLQLRLANVNPMYARPELPKVTWVTPKNAKHCQRLAIDINISAYPKSHWNIIGHIAEQYGLTWGGRWKCRDYCHLEM